MPTISFSHIQKAFYRLLIVGTAVLCLSVASDVYGATSVMEPLTIDNATTHWSAGLTPPQRQTSLEEFCGNFGINTLYTVDSVVSSGHIEATEVFYGTSGFYKSISQIYTEFGPGEYIYLGNNTGSCYTEAESTWYSFRVITDTSYELWDIFGGTSTPYNANYNSTQNTRFTNLLYSGTSSVSLDIEYFLDENEINVLQQPFNPTGVQLRYSQRPSSTTLSMTQNISNAIYNYSTTTFNFPSLSDGTYDVTARFYNFAVSFSGAEPPFKDSFVYSSFTIASGTLISFEPTEFYDRTTPIPETIYQPCGITDIGGCISNAFIYLFIPSAYSPNSIFTVRDELQTKAPFVYFYQVPQLWDTLYTSTQTQSLSIGVSTTIGHIDFISEAQLDAIPLTNTIRTIIGYLLWIMLALLLYSETRRIFNHQPTT